MDNQVINNDESRKIYQDLKEKHDLSVMEDVIKDNTIEFKYKEEIYRVRLFNRVDKEEIHLLQVKKYNQLIKEKDILTEEQLRVAYKEKGINIQEIDDNIRKLEIKRNELHLKLGEEESLKSSEALCKAYHDQILEIMDEMGTLILGRAKLFANSLEQLLQGYVTEVSTYFVFEKKDGETWSRVFKSLDDFLNCKDETFIAEAAFQNMRLNY